MRRSPLLRFVNVFGMLEGWEGSCFSLKEIERNRETFASLSLDYFVCVTFLKMLQRLLQFLSFLLYSTWNHCWSTRLFTEDGQLGMWLKCLWGLGEQASSKLPWSCGRGCIMSSSAWETNTHHKIVVPQEYKRWSQGKRTFWVIIHHFSILPLEGERLFN